jgi:hypothetical protein
MAERERVEVAVAEWRNAEGNDRENLEDAPRGAPRKSAMHFHFFFT